MQITKNTPKPVVEPPPTYDLTGLSQDDIMALRCILGRHRLGVPSPLESMRKQIWAVTKTLKQPFESSDRYYIRRTSDF